ncbi:MAG: ATP synthase subunit I [Proteobacteria bacterium]|nr:ATP synthase subunit I [Pseudomonadota bacterium]
MNTNISSRPVNSGALYNYSRGLALRVVAGQIVVGLALACCLAFVSANLGYSALVGAGIGILPTYYLAVRMFRRSRRALSPEQALRNIYLGEGLKVAFTIALFVLSILQLDVHLGAVAGAYMTTVVVNWVAIYAADLGESPRKRIGG